MRPASPALPKETVGASEMTNRLQVSFMVVAFCRSMDDRLFVGVRSCDFIGWLEW